MTLFTGIYPIFETLITILLVGRYHHSHVVSTIEPHLWGGNQEYTFVTNSVVVISDKRGTLSNLDFYFFHP